MAAATTTLAARVTSTLRKRDMRPVAREAASPTKVAVADVAATETSKKEADPNDNVSGRGNRY